MRFRTRELLKFLPALAFLAPLPLLAEMRRPPVATIHGREFAGNPDLHAGLRQTSILDLSPGLLGEPLARYQLEGGKYTFCLDENDPYLEGMTVESDAGKLVARVSRHNRCQKAVLTTGFYRIHLQRDLTAAPNATGKVAFVHADLPVVPLVNNAGVPAGGWWATRADPSVNLNGNPGYPHTHPDILAIHGTFTSGYQGRPWFMDFSDNPLDANSFLSFSDGANAYFSPHGTPRNDMMNTVTVLDLHGDSFGLPFMDDDSSSDWYSNFGVMNRGNYRFQMWEGNTNSELALGGTWYDQYGILFQQSGGPLQAINYLEVLFRYLPQGSAVGQLNPGEVALLQSCSGGSAGAVFAADQPDLASLSGSVINLDNTTLSVQVGNDTAVTLYSGQNFTGAATLVKSNTCLPGPTARSFKIQPLSTVINVGSNSCIGCLLEGADLSGLDLSGINLTRAYLNGAILTNTKLDEGTFANTNFAGATFHCTSLNGSDSDHLVDLTTAVLENIKVVPDSNCSINMSSTHLTLTGFPAFLWHSVDLSNATIDGVANQQLSTQSNPLDLTDAHLLGVSLEGVGLDYAKLTNADLRKTVMNNATLREVDAGSVKLSGANLAKANFDHANLTGAFLNPDPTVGAPSANVSSAFLRNVNLSNAQLSGADFSSANFYSTSPVNNLTCSVSGGFTQQCATASGATMNSTIFEETLLAGVDFTNTMVQGVRFGNAILIGANFTGAKISGDSTLGTDSGFTSAYLEGTNLQSVGTIDGTSFLNAFLDFGYQGQVGNTMYLTLNGAHTQFAGYWNAGGKGANGCIEVTYTQASTVPQRNTTITCPDGTAGSSAPLGCGAPSMVAANAPHWASGINISSGSAPASYQFAATYTSGAATPICTPDGQWNAAGQTQRSNRPQ